MGDLKEFSLPVRMFLKTYRWRRVDPVPRAIPRKPLEDSRLAIVSSAGFALPQQPPFDESLPGGDFTFREIPFDIDPAKLVNCHRSQSFDHSGMLEDPNLAFPIERVRELAEAGRIGSVNHRHLSFMGSITAPGRLIRYSAPDAAERLVQDQVDIALLIPV